MCGSWFGSPGKSRTKNETEKKKIFCCQLLFATFTSDQRSRVDNIYRKKKFFCCQLLFATFTSDQRSRVDNLYRELVLEKRPCQSGHSRGYSSYGRLWQKKC